MSILLNDKINNQEVLLAGTPKADLILSSTSKNPIANKAVYNALAQKIEKTVNDLVNYYTTSQVYNKQEVRDLIGSLNTLTIEVVAELPTSQISATTIYFVGPTSGTYDEYVYVNNTWVKIGDTDIDLSGYVTSADLTTALQSYYTKSAVDALLTSYYNKNEVDGKIDAKQDELTFDSAPTAGSTNPVTSGGIYTAMSSLASGGIRFNTDTNAVQVYNPNLNEWFNIHINVLDSLDYIRLQYITVNPHTYVTNYPNYDTSGTDWEMGFDFAFDSNSIRSGALTVAAEQGGMWLGNYLGYFVLRRYSVQDDIRITTAAVNTRHTYVVKSTSTNRQLYVDDALQGTSTASYLSTPTHYMFNDAASTTGGTPASGKFYGYYFKKNGNLVSRYIPVKRRSNGTVGIYDEIRNVFITPTGGSFSPGPVD